MSSSKQQTPVNPDPPNPADSSTLRPLNAVSADFDRSILGIPAEDDEFTRGLIFSFDPSTGLPSVSSTSQESEDPLAGSPYEPSRSSNNTSSLNILTPIFTPQSVSDASSGLHPRSAPSQSVGSSDGGSSVHEADELQSLSVPLKVTAGTSEAACSPKPIQTLTYLPMAGVQPSSTVSPVVHPSSSEHFSIPEDVNDPRMVIDIGPNDIKFLAEIIRRESPSRPGYPAQALDLMDLTDDQISQTTTSPQPGLAKGSKHGETHESIWKHTRARKERVSQPKHHPKGRRASDKDATENVKLMRQIGVCLPCLVNHEHVSISYKYHCSRAALILEV